VTTLESPFQPYVAHYKLHSGAPPDAATRAFLDADTAARIAAALGDTDALSSRAFHLVLLDSMVHEFNVVRALLGEPDAIDFADIRQTGLTVILRFGDTHCIIAWVDLPGIARYQMEFALYAPSLRLTLSMPSPFLRSAPTLLTTEAGEADTARSWRTEEITSYAESFRQELVHFHDCIRTGHAPLTSGQDALRDIALCQAIVAAHRDRKPISLT
jgi:predicted dehydrogenase